MQVELWNEFKKAIKKIQPIDILVVNGDAIEGKGTRSGSTELIQADMNKQCDQAVEIINFIDADTVVMTYGTAYHTSPAGEDWERVIADRVGATIGDHEWLDINGLVFDCKHHVGGTSVPYSKGTQVSKDQLANLLWAEQDEQPRADIFIRSHVHSFFQCGEDHWLGVVLPALQGAGSKFGGRRCSMPVNFGIVWFDVDKNGEYSWNKNIIRVESQKAKVVVL